MPGPVVSVTVNPLSTMRLREEILNPFVPPRTVTGPPVVVTTIGALAVPDAPNAMSPAYVPAPTATVCPATAIATPCRIVQNGTAALPGPESEQAPLARSTNKVLGAAPAGGADATATADT